jgi:nucleolar protein 14
MHELVSTDIYINLILILLQPSDRLKSEEELAREEKERLEKLEMERLQRMHGFKEDLLPETKHRSADDLDDGFVFNP